jgi:hypothetical protein
MAEQGNDQMLEQAGEMDEVTQRAELDEAAVVEEERKTEAAPEAPDG